MVQLIIRTSLRGLSKKNIERFIRAALAVLDLPAANLAVVLTGDREIRRHNRKFLKHDRATDVLAFPVDPIPRGKGRGKAFILGDLIISLERARSQARRFHTGYKEETALYIVHGMLHLLGYDDHTTKDRKRMRIKEAETLARIARRIGKNTWHL